MKAVVTRVYIWQGRFPAGDRGEDGYHGTSPVTAFPANGFGLHDMGGNVWQWCADLYDPKAGAANRVARGSNWGSDDQACMAASRYECTTSSRYSYLGLRLARVPSAPVGK